MNTCYRTLCYGTAIQKVLRGSFCQQDNLDLVLVKNYSLQYMRIQTDHSTDETNNDIISAIFEQQAFGSILDAKVLPCTFQEPEQTIPTDEDIGNKALTNYDINVDSHEEQLNYTQNTRTGHTKIQGNDMVAAISEYGQLVFITVVGRHLDLATTGRFECVTEITLDEPGSEYTKVNKKLAIDPWSRAIAISSYQDRIDIMILNDSMSRIHFSPVAGMGSIQEEGIIWHMEFLHTETKSWDRILLAAIVYNDTSRLCRIILFSIDASDSQKVSIKVVGRLPLDYKTPLPVLIIPLPCYHESFMVVTERTVCVLSADDISCGNVLYPVIPISSNDFDPATNEDILITSYSLPADPNLPYVYLGTAEGYLLQLDISEPDCMKWIPCLKVNSIGQQMCVLGLIEVDDVEGALWTAEVLLYIGEGADSQMIAVPWKDDDVDDDDDDGCNVQIPFVLQTLINRAPLTDWQAVRKLGQPDRLVVCSGQDEQGALHSISRDMNSTLLYASDMDWNGITKMWCINNSLGRCHLVASSAYSTRVTVLDYGDRMNEDTTKIVDTQVPSVFAGSFEVHGSTVAVQITRNGIVLLDMNGEPLLCYPNPKGFTTITGTAWLFDDSLRISTCLSNGELHSFQAVSVCCDKGHTNLKTTLDCLSELSYLPSCLYRFTMVDQNDSKLHQLVAIGSYDSKIYVYSMYSQTNFSLRQKVECNDIPHSLATINTSGQQHLLIGTRSGSLIAIDLSCALDPQNPNQVIDTNNIWTQSLGSSPVILSANENGNLAFALCECIWMIDYDCDSRLLIEAIYQHEVTNIEAILPLDLSYDQQEQLDGQKLAFVSAQGLYIIQANRKSQITTRKHMLSSTPRKLLLHDHSTSYLVTSSKHRGKTYYQLKLIDQSGELLCEHRFAYGEIVLSISKWQVQNKNKLYHYICVGIEHQDSTPTHNGSNLDDNQHGKGSLHLYRLKAQKTIGKNSQVQYSIRLVWKCEGLNGGVHTICPHPSGLLFSSGSTLHLHHLDMSRGALVEITHKVLRFPITSIHVVGDRICVTGHVESVSFYSYDKDTMHLSFLKSDSISRNVHHSLLLNNRTVIGVSLSGGMFALNEPATDTTCDDDSLQTLFCFHYPDIIVNPHCISLHSRHSAEYTTGILVDHLIPWQMDDESNTNDELDGTASTTEKNAPIEKEQNLRQKAQQARRSQSAPQPIIGCTVSGGVVAVYQCSATLYALLNTLQQHLLRYTSTQPLLGSPSRFSKWYTHLSGPAASTIHFDYISLYIRLTTKQQCQVVRSIEETDDRQIDDSGVGEDDNGGSTDADANTQDEGDLDDNDDDNDDDGGKVGSPTRSLIDWTLAIVEEDNICAFRNIPDWTPFPDHGDDNQRISWTARTLELVITKLENYYF